MHAPPLELLPSLSQLAWELDPQASQQLRHRRAQHRVARHEVDPGILPVLRPGAVVENDVRPFSQVLLEMGVFSSLRRIVDFGLIGHIATVPGTPLDQGK
jgi:hypothetical protein